MANYAITYNSSLNLNGTTYVTENIDDASTPELLQSSFNLARYPGAVITDTNYGGKTIKLRGKIYGTSTANCDSLIDALHAALAVSSKSLDFEYNSSTRRYTSTPSRVQINRPLRTSWAEWEIDFLATEYGKDTSATALYTASSITTTPNTKSVTIGGSAPDQFVRVQLTVTAATGLSSKYISVENDTTGQTLTVTRTWIVGDVLIIDPSAHTVKVNGTDTDFTGAFPMYAPGTHNMIIANDFTTRTLTLTSDYIKRYL